MALEELKDRINEQFQALASRVQESTAWQQLMERFQDLSPTAQRLVLSGVGFALALILLLLPWTFFSTSQTTVSDFEAKKQLVRDLYRYSHQASRIPPAPPLLSPGELRSQVQGILATERPPLLAEQTLGIDEIDNQAVKSAALPGGLMQKSLTVRLSRLNLDQIGKIGAKLQELRPTVKMVGVRVQATPADAHYFDVTFKLVSFNLPEEPAAKPGSPGGGKPGAKPTAKPGNGKAVEF